MILSEIGQYLDNESLGTLATNIFLGRLPTTPGTCVSLFENAGMGPQHTFGSTTPAWESPMVQVICRSTDYATARNKADDIWRLLTNVVNQTLKPSTAAAAVGCKYLRVDAMQSPFLLERDEADRILIGCNYRVLKELSS